LSAIASHSSPGFSQAKSASPPEQLPRRRQRVVDVDHQRLPLDLRQRFLDDA
jgi:hypothetical protein